MASTDLTPIALTQDDIMLITRALRIMSQDTGFSTIRDAAKNLIEYIENENKISEDIKDADAIIDMVENRRMNDRVIKFIQV